MNLNDNLVAALPPSIANCSRLKVLRVQNNSLTLNSIPLTLLTESNVSLLAVEGNLFQMKQFQDATGYDKVTY